MSDTNSSNKANENAEQNNNRDKTDKEKFLTDFIDSQESDPKKKSELLKELYGKKGSLSKIRDDLKKFKRGPESVAQLKGDKYGGFNIDDSITIELKKRLFSDHTKLQNKRSTLMIHFGSEYNLTSDQSNKINTALEEEDEKSLEDLSKPESKYKNTFIEEIFKQNRLVKKEFLALFSNVHISEKKKEKLAKLTGEEKENMSAMLVHLEDMRGKTLNSYTDLGLFKDLLSSSFFDTSEKKEIIETFIPTISLQKCRDFGLKNNAEILKIGEAFVSENFSEDEIIKIAGSHKKEDIEEKKKDLAQSINLEDIHINTQSVLKLDSTVEKVSSDSDLGAMFSKTFIARYNDSFKNEFDERAEKFKDFPNELGKEKNVSGSEKFRRGSIIQIKIERVEDGVKEEETVFQEVLDDGSKTGVFITENRGRSGVYNGKSTGIIEYGHEDAIDLLKNGKGDVKILSYDIFHKDEFKEKLKSKEIKELDDSFELKTSQEIETKAKQLENDHRRSLEVEELRKAIATGDLKLDPNLSDDDLRLGVEARTYLEENNKEYKGKVEDYLESEEYLDSLKGLNEFNYEYTKDKLDNIDPDGKLFGLQAGVTIVTGKGATYSITKVVKDQLHPDRGGVCPGYIELENAWGGKTEVYDFAEFYENFKTQDTKRTSKAKDFGELLNDTQDHIGAWNNFSLDDGKIKSNDKEKQKFDFDFLVAEKDKSFIKGYNLVKIHSIDGGRVSISLGNVDDGEGKNKGNTVYKTERDVISISVGMLHTWIKDARLEPKSLKDENTIEEEKIESVERKGSLSSRFFSRLSVAELIAGGKFWIESIEQKLKEGNDEHAAKFASMLWLPKELKRDMKMRVETAQKKRMDEYIEKLESVDSKDATEMIQNWLENKDSNEHQKEAAFIFMVKKYGTLYTKSALYKYKGRFLWYEALGGRVGDDLYNKVKADAKSQDIQFSEETLVHQLIAGQCKGYKKPRRRSRLYKELEALLGIGKTEQWEKGQKDAKKKRTIDGRIKIALAELDTGSYPNAMGALAEIVNKGDDGNITPMNKIPFIMLFSGLAYNFDQDMCDKFKNMTAESQLIPSAVFLSNVSKIDTFNETVLELSKDLEDTLGGKYKGMHERANKIFKNQKKSGKEDQKVSDTVEFFNDYGEVLTRSMNFLNTGKDDELSIFDKRIFYKKDENKVYNKYYKTFEGIVTHASFVTNKDEGLLTDSFRSDLGDGGVSGMNIYKVVKENLLPISGSVGFRMTDSGPMFWSEIQRQFKHNQKVKFESEDYRKAVIKNDLRGLMAGLIEKWGGRKGLKDFYDSPIFHNKFIEWGIKLEYFDGMSYEDILDEENVKADSALDKCVKHIVGDTSSVDAAVSSTKNKTSSVV